jgi:D-serine deaminase-like pyridoxal phosphate-dependent protein
MSVQILAGPECSVGRLPNEPIETPCFLIYEDAVRHNLRCTAEAAGGIDRLMPHVKTHRAPWIVTLLLEQGVTAFKCATLAEVQMVLETGGLNVTWAYPTVNAANLMRFVGLARRFPDALLTGLVDSERGIGAWREALRDGPANIGLRVDLDPGLGRTGVAMSDEALKLARALHAIGRLAGWHVYDGHVKGDREARQQQVTALADQVRALRDTLRGEGIETDMTGGGSYTFNLWPGDLARFVSPGSWTFSSAQHDIELADLGWQPAAFVVATTISVHAGTATFDAGCKAISPDKPLAERFRWDGRIILMNEEHTVVESHDLSVGDRVLLMPQHACTTAYMYSEALVNTSSGSWERRSQLGSAR